MSVEHPEFQFARSEVENRTQRLLAIPGKRTVDSFHRELGKVMWEDCGMARNRKGLEAAPTKIAAIREEFWNNVNVTGEAMEVNQALEKAGRVADFLELGELICRDALEREESCGAHFREEYQTADGEALRNDEKFAHAAVWEYAGENAPPVRNTEPLQFDYVHLTQRSYK